MIAINSNTIIIIFVCGFFILGMMAISPTKEMFFFSLLLIVFLIIVAFFLMRILAFI